MQFASSTYSPEIQAILAFEGDGHRLMALATPTCISEQARSYLRTRTAHGLFPDAQAPEAALAGLWLYFGCFDESHTVAQDVHTAEGSYWHGILHRQEPDPGNAAYWFRRVASHPTFTELREVASRIIGQYQGVKFAIADPWDPFAFIDFCEAARRRPASDAEKAAREIQRAEWQLLFDYCARSHE